MFGSSHSALPWLGVRKPKGTVDGLEVQYPVYAGILSPRERHGALQFYGSCWSGGSEFQG